MCYKISNTFLFLVSKKMVVIRAGIHKTLVRIANREGPDQTGSALFVQAIRGYGMCSKISNTFLILFSNKMVVIRAGIHKSLSD